VETLRASHNSHTHIDNTCQFDPQVKECSCSSAISSHNSRDAILSHNSRNAHESSSLRYHPKPFRSCITTRRNKSQALPLQYCLALLQSRQAKAKCKPPRGTSLPPSTKHPWTYYLYRYCLAERTSPLGATRSRTLLICNFGLAIHTSPPGTTPVLRV